MLPFNRGNRIMTWKYSLELKGKHDLDLIYFHLKNDTKPMDAGNVCQDAAQTLLKRAPPCHFPAFTQGTLGKPFKMVMPS